MFTPGGPRLTESLRLGLDAGRAEPDGGAPGLETRYRFSGACVESGCAFWQEGSCAAISAAYQEYGTAGGGEPASTGEPLPACGIRDTCRWWAQEGPRACGVCPYVVTSANG